MHRNKYAYDAFDFSLMFYYHRNPPMSAEEALVKVQNLIYSLVNSHQKRYGGRRNELLSEAYMGFMQAHQTFNPEKGAFTTHVHYNVRGKLLDSLHKKEVQALPEFINNIQNVPDFNLERLFIEISIDASTVIKIALEAPLISKNKRKWLIQNLITMGWSASRIAKSFQEIEEILYG